MIKKYYLILLLFLQCESIPDKRGPDPNIEYALEMLKMPKFLKKILKKYGDEDVGKFFNRFIPIKINKNKAYFQDGLIIENNTNNKTYVYDINKNQLKIEVKEQNENFKINVSYKNIKDEITIDKTSNCIHKGTNDNNLLQILYLLSIDENRTKKLSAEFRNEFNKIKHFLYAIAAKSCIKKDKLLFNLSEALYPVVFLPPKTLTDFNNKIKSNKLIIGEQYILFPTDNLTMDTFNEFVWDKKNSDKQKEEYLDQYIKLARQYNFKVNVSALMNIIMFGHFETYIYFPNIKKILFIDSANDFDHLNERDNKEIIYISSSDLLKKQNGKNCFTCATLNICLLSEYLSKNDNHKNLESIMSKSSQKNKNELVEFMKGMFNTNNEILKKCVDLNYTNIQSQTKNTL